MVSGNNSCFQGPQGMPNYGAVENMISSSSHTAPESESHSNALLYNLSLLREKVQQVQSLVDVLIFPDQGQEDSVGIAVAGVGTLIQEIIVTASSMMYTCQKMALDAAVHRRTDELHQRPNKVSDDGGSSSQPRIEEIDHAFPVEEGRRGFFSSETIEGYHDNQDYSGNNDDEVQLQHGVRMNQELHNLSSMNCDVVELDASDLLAKYTHYCQVCGKGFKRDANLRMHMRAHGDQYKSKSALSNPIKNSNNSMDYLSNSPRKYSCPQEGCRWNKKHAKFQPLKSMICVKNHYKRSHCPKMYICNRCNQKQFSLLSDLRTHEKHCGDLKWQCSCGTTFSRKDKLLGHLSLFVGHAPAMNCIMSETKFDSQ